MNQPLLAEVKDKKQNIELGKSETNFVQTISQKREIENTNEADVQSETKSQKIEAKEKENEEKKEELESINKNESEENTDEFKKKQNKINSIKQVLLTQMQEGGKKYNPPKIKNTISKFAWNFDDSKLAISQWNQNIVIWDIESDNYKIIQTAGIGAKSWDSNEQNVLYLNEEDEEEERKNKNIDEEKKEEEIGDLNKIQKIIQVVGVGTISWHPTQNKLLYLNKYKKGLFIFDLNESMNGGDLILSLNEKEVPKQDIFFCCWHPSGKEIAYYIENMLPFDIIIYNLDSKEKKYMNINYKKIHDFKWSPSGSKIAFSGDEFMTLWDFKEQREVLKIKKNSDNMLSNINWSKDEHRICFLCASKTNTEIIIWNVEDDYEEGVCESLSTINSIDWSCDEKFILAGNQERTVTMWDAQNYVEIMSTDYNENKVEIECVKWNKNSTKYVVKSKSFIQILEWNLKRKLRSELEETLFENKISKLQWSENNEKLFIVFSNFVEIWDNNLNKLLGPYENLNYVLDIILDEKQNILICLCSDTIELRSLNMEKNMSDSIDNEKDIKIVRANSNFSLLVGACDKIIVIISVKNNKINEILNFNAHLRNVTDVRWERNSDRNRFLSVSNDGSIKVWDIDSEKKKQKEIIAIKKHIGKVNCAIWDESNKFIISAGSDQFIKIFKSVDGTELQSIHMNDDNIRNIGLFNIFEENFFYCFTSVPKYCLQVIDFKSGFILKTINFDFNQDCSIKFLNCDSDNILFASQKQYLKYNKEKLWNNFESYEYLYFLIDYLPKIGKLKKKNAKIVESIINNFFFPEAPSAFHILSIFGLQDELDVLLKFCMKYQIFPKKFFDSKDSSLFTILNNRMRLSSLDLFFDFAIASNVQIGNFFHVSEKELISYMKKNSLKVCKLLESRFKDYEDETFKASWSSNSKKYSNCLISDYKNIKQEELKSFKKVKILEVENNKNQIVKKENLTKLSRFRSCVPNFIACFEKNKAIKNNFDESQQEKSCFKILDIPLKEIAIKFIQELPNSKCFDEFCQNPLIISILDVLWDSGARFYFNKKSMIYLLYFAILFVNSVVILPNYLKMIESDYHSEINVYWTVFLIFSISLLFLSLLFIKEEIKEIKNEGMEYLTSFNSFWNYVDWINITCSLICNIYNIVFLFLSGGSTEHRLLRIFNSISFFFSMVRIFDIFRQFKKTCFLIQTVLQVVYDMKIFFLLMALFVSTFSFSIYILQIKHEQNIAECLYIIYKLIFGISDDYFKIKTLPEIESEPQTDYLLILIYIFATLLLIIVMLNLLIAIVSDTNARVSNENELIYEKNRVYIIREYLSEERAEQYLKEKFLITIFREKNQIEENISNSDFNYRKLLNQTIEKKSKKSNRALTSLTKKNNEKIFTELATLLRTEMTELKEIHKNELSELRELMKKLSEKK